MGPLPALTSNRHTSIVNKTVDYKIKHDCVVAHAEKVA